MPTNRIDSTQQTTAVNAQASPVTVTIPAHPNAITLVITSASAITITGMTGPGNAVDLIHTP